MPSPPLAVSIETSAAAQLAVLAIAGLLYTWRAHTLSQGEGRVPAPRRASFYGGLALAAGALAGLGPTGQHLLWVHMVQTILLGDLAALSIVLGLTEPLLAPLQRLPLIGRVRMLAHPAVAFPLWLVDLYAWHLRVFFQAAMHHTSLQALQHALLLALGMNMWMCLFGPLSKPRWFGHGAKLGYVLAVRLAGATLANLLLWSGTIFYPYFLTGEARFHVSPVADQNVAGALMLGEEAILTLCLLYWLAKRTGGPAREPVRQPAGTSSTEDAVSVRARTSAHGGLRGAESPEPMQARASERR
ncbi:MAG: cytochrome c oxidase assembly protein [Solirubrobacteraceae bacterium]